MRTSVESLRHAVSVGAVAGVVVLYVTAVGIVLAFAERNMITDVLTLGRLMLAIPPLAGGYMVAARPGSLANRLASGLVAGAVAGLMLAAGILLSRSCSS